MGFRQGVKLVLCLLAMGVLPYISGSGCGGSNSNVSGQGSGSDFTTVSLQARISSGVAKGQGTTSCAETCEYTYTAGIGQTTKSHQTFSALPFRCNAQRNAETEQGFDATFLIDPRDQEVLEGGIIEVTCCPAGGSLIDDATFNTLTINCFNDSVNFNAQDCLRDSAKCTVTAQPTSLGEEISQSGITGLLSTLKCPTLNFLNSFCQSDSTSATASSGFTCGSITFFLALAQCPAVEVPKCGNGTIDPGEWCDASAGDSPFPHGGCSEGTCLADCSKCSVMSTTCGNNTCDSCEEFQVDGAQFCGFDCGPAGGNCGDGICNRGESTKNCPHDCLEIEILCRRPSAPCTSVNCDCKGAFGADSECVNGCCTIPRPPPDPYCGDGLCNGTETQQTCAFDCGGDTTGPHSCGNGLKEGPEICENGGTFSDGCQGGRLGSTLRCSQNNDCVACEVVNLDAPCDQDGYCEKFEDPQGCPTDCRCGNGRCDLPYETGSTTPCPVDFPDCGVVSCPQDCSCGNGHLDPGEQCDDGNPFDNDGCNRFCQIECGDGLVEQSEECDFVAERSDPGNPVCGNTFGPGWTCNTNCHCAPAGPQYCGNGIIDAPGEVCDGSAGCGPLERCNHFCDHCELNICDGDGFAEVGEQCDIDGVGNVFTPTCPEGQICVRCQCVAPR